MATTITMPIRLEYENTFRREMLVHLTPAETKVMTYIIDKTLGWMRDRERISYRELDTGKGNNKGAGISLRGATKCIEGLVKKGAIIIEDSCRKLGTLIVINLDWGKDNVLKEPKQAKKGSSKLTLDSDSVLLSTTQCTTEYNTGVLLSNTPLNKGNKRTNNKLLSGKQVTAFSKQDNLKPVANSTIEDAIEKGKAKHSSAVDRKRQKNLNRAKGGEINSIMLYDSLLEGMRESDSSANLKVWTRVEQAQAKRSVKSLGISPTESLELFKFIGSNWGSIMRSKFEWATNAASLPDIGFILKYGNEFLATFRTGLKVAKAEKESSMGGRIARMVANGHTVQSAEEELERISNRRGNSKGKRRRNTHKDSLSKFHQYASSCGSEQRTNRQKQRPVSEVPDSVDDMVSLELPTLGEWKEE